MTTEKWLAFARVWTGNDVIGHVPYDTHRTEHASREAAQQAAERAVRLLGSIGRNRAEP